jgi:phage terminase large subunit-like protein
VQERVRRIRRTKPNDAHHQLTKLQALLKRALDDPKLFGRILRGDSWQHWLVFLYALFALPMTPEQLQTYQHYTGRHTPPTAPAREAWLVIGRRGGKSFILALIAVFLATFIDWRPYLNVGQCGTVMVIAADRRQARVIMRYVLGLLRSIPMLKRQVLSANRERIELDNRVTVEIHAASFKSTRGYSIVAALLDELAYWPTDEDAAEPDVEIITAIKPGMLTIPQSMLLCASSPYGRKGSL